MSSNSPVSLGVVARKRAATTLSQDRLGKDQVPVGEEEFHILALQEHIAHNGSNDPDQGPDPG